ncbi:hypothetical protein [Saccharothrix yanglingensis]|uniref:Secreted protein n=1 Tax=Saccharothrix yanglingensis TaxID=659496 RepID=A0ABU0X5R4_9PSEU|nr:hypothetical protein [Saccharothrix yanglingensis]MDQ2587346.1 hypothetical protein [Saccharothrix yanglingensis]
MNTLAALAQSTATTSYTPLAVMIMTGAMALVLGMARLLRRVLGILTKLLVSAGAVLTGFATVLAFCSVLTTVMLVYLR